MDLEDTILGEIRQTEKIKLPQIYTNIFAEEIAMSDAYKENFDKYFGHTLSSSH